MMIGIHGGPASLQRCSVQNENGRVLSSRAIFIARRSDCGCPRCEKLRCFVNSVGERYIFYIGVGEQAIGIVKIIEK
ncbi:MAG: hypothetical protein ACI85Z_001473 [Rheinheimera aquimaris]|jgi:hypothetical protein